MQDQIIETTRSTDEISTQKITPKDPNKTKDLLKELTTFIGAKVMFHNNIDTQKGVVDGAIGSIVNI